jgi:hypothetical protein
MGNFFALLFEVFLEPVQWWLWKRSRADDDRKEKQRRAVPQAKEPTVR